MKGVVKRGWLAGALLAAAAAARGAWIFDGRPESWEGTPEELKVPPRTFPVLVLDLGGAWTDFELKASTNNFESLCYYVMSSGTNAWTSDPDVEIHFTDDCSADVRKWWKSAPGVSIGSQLADGVNSVVVRAVVAPSHTCTEDWETWMSRDNAALVWSYVRYDGIGLEMNATGTKSRWSAVVPVEWRPELPQWPMLGPGASAAPVTPNCPGAHPLKALEAPSGLLGLLLPAWLPLRVAAGAVEGGTPAYGPLRGAAPAAADPFLGPFDVWSHGPLGDVRRQGLAALAAGDGELARELVERYWRLMETALERRRRHAGGEGIRMLEGRE